MFPIPLNRGYNCNMDEDTIILAVEVAGFSFVAFCTWLGVRIFNRRERWAKRLALALALSMFLYGFSIGPVFRFRLTCDDSHSVWTAYAIEIYCAPVDVACACGPDWAGTLIGNYLRWWVPPLLPWFIPSDSV